MSEEKLIGDHIEELFKTTKIDKVAKVVQNITKKPCNCQQRKTNLNELHKRLRRRIKANNNDG